MQLLLHLTKLVVFLNLVVYLQFLSMVFFVILEMEYCLYLLHIVKQNFIVYFIFVKKRKKKDCLILIYYVKLLVLYLVFRMIPKKENVMQLWHILQEKLTVYLMVYLMIFKVEDCFYPLFTLFRKETE